MNTLIAAIVATSLVLSAEPAPQPQTQTPLPNVLIIGDSISIGYMKPLTELLKGKANLVHNEGNATHSGNGLAKLDEWLGDTKWDVIHFNHGLHDLKYLDAEGKSARTKEGAHIQVPVEKYKENMEGIVQRLKKTGAKLIFATTTPYPDKVEGPLREKGDAERYNAAALEVMKRHDIAIDDLYTFALPRLTELQMPNNVHFTEKGSEVLAEKVAKHIQEALNK
ncbi:MAG: SGNH/GDSL hydrolase family protein [Candidatus Hydrogenedentes bacterium]|nr:SGNH/GDSL hydrolase family protein [Candidatus Hydrogenedentota bacterium]